MRRAPDGWGAALGPGQGRESLEGGGGARAAARVAGASARGTWPGAGTRRSAPSHCFPAPQPLDLPAGGRGPPAYEDRSAGGRAGDGQSRTRVRRGSGANRSPAMGRRELGAVAFPAGMCVRVVAVVLL